MTINNNENNFPSITAGEGKYLTNGIVVVDGEVFVRNEREADCWREVDSIDEAIIIDEFEAFNELISIFNANR